MNKFQEYAVLADIKLMKLTLKAGDKLAFVTGISCFKQGVAMMYLAPLAIFLHFIVDYINEPVMLGFGILVAALWIWTSHRQIKTMKKIKALAEDGRINIDVFTRMLVGTSSLRILTLALGFLLPFSVFWVLAHVGTVIGQYLLWHWEPPKDTLKKRIKEKLSNISLVPAPLPSPS